MAFKKPTSSRNLRATRKRTSMSIWKTTPIDQTPEIRLSSWSVFELPNGDRHFVGYNETEHEGRVSSMIMTFDPGTMKGVTRSGRVYQLVGPPGYSTDGTYVWYRWCNINDVDVKSAKCVDDIIIVKT